MTSSRFDLVRPNRGTSSDPSAQFFFGFIHRSKFQNIASNPSQTLVAGMSTFSCLFCLIDILDYIMKLKIERPACNAVLK